MSSARLLDGRVAIVTGASRGIGAAIARRFAAEGAKLAIVARTVHPGGKLPGSLAETAGQIAAMGAECLMIKADLADPADRVRIVPETIARFGRIDILVNNAAWSRFIPIWEVQPRQTQLALEMNLLAPQDISAQALAHMRAQGEGWILNISSATADLPPPAPWDENNRYVAFNRDGHATLYGTSKAALDRLTAGWAVELSRENIAVNSLAPVGAVASEGALAVGGWDERDHIEPVEAMAEAALHLCHRPASELSGNVVRSLPLLDRLGVDIRTLDGTAPLGWKPPSPVVPPAVPLPGTWALTSYVLRGADGSIIQPMGPNACGQINYDAAGNMACSLVNPDPSAPGHFDGDAAAFEARLAYSRYSSYFGTYDVDRESRTVRHHVSGSSMQGWAGTTVARNYRFDGADRLILSADVGAGGMVAELAWRRIG